MIWKENTKRNNNTNMNDLERKNPKRNITNMNDVDRKKPKTNNNTNMDDLKKTKWQQHNQEQQHCSAHLCES